MKPLISIVIPAWNHLAETMRCLYYLKKSLLDDERVEIIIIDNGSADGTAETIARDFKGTVLINNENNLGFSVAINQGVLKSTGDYVLLLNNDTWRFEKGFLTKMTSALTDPQAAIVGEHHTWRNAEIGNYSQAYLAFYCVMIPNKTFHRVGLLDMQFTPAGWEDVDWCKRALMAGYTLATIEFEMSHAANTTVRDLPAQGQQSLDAGLEKFKEKWGIKTNEVDANGV